MADVLRAPGLRYVALNLDASYRGLHDTLVNQLGDTAPRMRPCLHEKAGVAPGHGDAKVADERCGVTLHGNAGFLDGATALSHAWCDRPPMLAAMTRGG